ncbi:hypothetical protein diail_9876 [Diaporthe ilicicola]|nr:hypothetical protein diail_9876 [Diaporthe ilicicola]
MIGNCGCMLTSQEIPTLHAYFANMAPQLIFGTATFGMEMTDFQAADSVKPLLQALTKLGIDRLDTAARYPPLNPGRSEQLIGESELPAGFTVDTKVYTDTRGDGSGDLTSEAVDKSVNASLERLGNATHVPTYLRSFLSHQLFLAALI